MGDSEEIVHWLLTVWRSTLHDLSVDFPAWIAEIVERINNNYVIIISRYKKITAFSTRSSGDSLSLSFYSVI